MLYKFERVMDGIAKYINDEIYVGMNDLQELIARMAVGRIIDNGEQIKAALENNGVIRTLGIIDGEGMVDVDSLMKDIKKEIERKGSLVVSIPMFGKLTFKPSDADVLYKYITGGNYL